MRHGSLDEEICGPRINIEGFIPQREIEIRNALGHDYRAGAVDYDINGGGIETLERGIDNGLIKADRCGIGLDRNGLDSEALDLLDCFCGPVGIFIVVDDNL